MNTDQKLCEFNIVPKGTWFHSDIELMGIKPKLHIFYNNEANKTITGYTDHEYI